MVKMVMALKIHRANFFFFFYLSTAGKKKCVCYIFTGWAFYYSLELGVRKKNEYKSFFLLYDDDDDDDERSILKNHIDKKRKWKN